MEAVTSVEAKIENTAQPKVVLPSISYDRGELDEIIEEIPRVASIIGRIKNYLTNIEEQISAINSFKAKRHPENFYKNMHNAVLEIKNTANSIYELTKNRHATLPSTLKQKILKWVEPLETELKWLLEMSVIDRINLELKTKSLYAEQSLISRVAASQVALMRHLANLQQLLLDTNKPSPRCYISYAWASPEYQQQEYWVQPFLAVLYDHLTTAGIRVIMDILDNIPGGNIYRFMQQYHDGNYIILIGTESLLKKHSSEKNHAVKTELSIIFNRFEEDIQQFGQSRIYPMLISGTIKSSYPEIFDKYNTVRDARDGGYIKMLQKIIAWIYESKILEECDFCLMADLPNQDVNQVDYGIVYIDEDGKYCIKNKQSSIIYQGVIDTEQINLTNLEEKLNNQIFKSEVLSVLSARNHTTSALHQQYANLWRDFFTKCPNLSTFEAVEQELTHGYHLQPIDYLRQHIQFKNNQDKVEQEAQQQLENQTSNIQMCDFTRERLSLMRVQHAANQPTSKSLMFSEMPACSTQEQASIDQSLIAIQAASEGNIIKLKDLLEASFDINKQVGDGKRTLLHYAIITNQMETIKFLLQRDARVDLADENGKTAGELLPEELLVNKARLKLAETGP